METPPGKVIRSLRQALDMTQAEFARAAGWSPSTISSWERGSKQPSRVAFKTILAFAEERGVRYQQPKSESAVAPASPETLPVLRLGSRLPTPAPPPTVEVMPLSTRDAGREESFGSRRWTEIASHGSSPTFEPRPATVGERPEWQVEARLHVRIGAGSERVRRLGYVAASLAALVIGAGTGMMLRSGTSAPAARDATVSRAVEHVTVPAAPAVATAPEPAPPIEVDELALAALAAPRVPGPPLAAGQLAELAPRAETPPPALVPSSAARLESIVSLDGIRRATFRVGDRSIALVEGDEIGGRAIAMIANDEVAVVGSGVAERVRLGAEMRLR